MIALVCGDRYWTNGTYLYKKLDYIHDKYHLTAIVEGECTGADELAGDWAETRDIKILTRTPWIHVLPSKLASHAVNAGRVRGYPALWQTHHRAAGPIRNKEMLDKEKPDIGIAFHDSIETSSGTRGMIALLKKAHVSPIYIFSAQKDTEEVYETTGLGL